MARAAVVGALMLAAFAAAYLVASDSSDSPPGIPPVTGAPPEEIQTPAPTVEAFTPETRLPELATPTPRATAEPTATVVPTAEPAPAPAPPDGGGGGESGGGGGQTGGGEG